MSNYNPEMIADLLRQRADLRSELQRFYLAVSDFVRTVNSDGDPGRFRPELTRVEAALELARAILEKT